MKKLKGRGFIIIQQLMDEAEYDLKSYGGWGGCHPLRPINLRWITPSKMSIIPHVTQKPNPIIVLTFIQKLD